MCVGLSGSSCAIGVKNSRIDDDGANAIATRANGGDGGAAAKAP
jgi:hypothetical protein